MMQLRVNGVKEDVAASTVSELLTSRGVDPAARFVAVAINGSVVRRSEWSSKPPVLGRLKVEPTVNVRLQGRCFEVPT